MIIFPDPENASPDGLLCIGGNLTPDTLLTAYSQGIFPLAGPDEPITWWSPDPRCVLFLENFRLSSRTRRYLKTSGFTVTVNSCFTKVLEGCAAPRKVSSSTWLVPELIASMTKLHYAGIAHSVETWLDGELVGGLYGLVMGRVFCGESMFHFKPEASRAALRFLVSLLAGAGFLLIDCQQDTPHMLAMGATLIPRKQFLEYLKLR